MYFFRILSILLIFVLSSCSAGRLAPKPPLPAYLKGNPCVHYATSREINAMLRTYGTNQIHYVQLDNNWFAYYLDENFMITRPDGSQVLLRNLKSPGAPVCKNPNL